MTPVVALGPLLASALTALTGWAIDDGEKIPRDVSAATSALARGEGNPIWGPGRPLRLFALRDETVAFQVVVEGPASGVRVDVEGLDPAIAVARFVEPFFDLGRSTQAGTGNTLGWHAGAAPPPGRFVGWFPDPLVPIEVAPAWAPWPMTIAAGQNGVVWVDLDIPSGATAGLRRARVVVRSAGGSAAVMPLELSILDATLPVWPVRTWLFYGRSDLGRSELGRAELASREGAGAGADVEASVDQLLTLYHKHRVTGFDSVNSVADVRRDLPALDGSLYSATRGYRGPGAEVGDGLVVLGAYGTFHAATAEHLAEVEAIADELAAHGIFERAEVVLYADDERCDSPAGAGWRALLAGARNANARRVRVAWTCSDAPAAQPVDVPIVFAGEYDTRKAAAARAAGKDVWIYNGYRPATGSLLTDTAAIDLRTFGWIAAAAQISRWFIWNTNAWSDANPGGHGPFDPFVTAATGHNDAEGSTLMGDGLLVYPGRLRDRFAAHSLGIAGVVPSVRLKNLRRGIEDAGYVQLARGAARAEADAIVRALFPRMLAEAALEDPPAWGESGARFFEARQALAQLIATGADPGPGQLFGGGPRPERFHLRRRYRALLRVSAGVFLLAVGRAWWGRRRPRDPPPTC
jgi:Domain of unknown function (DUF4091)